MATQLNLMINAMQHRGALVLWKPEEYLKIVTNVEVETNKVGMPDMNNGDVSKFYSQYSSALALLADVENQMEISFYKNGNQIFKLSLVDMDGTTVQDTLDVIQLIGLPLSMIMDTIAQGVGGPTTVNFGEDVSVRINTPIILDNDTINSNYGPLNIRIV